MMDLERAPSKRRKGQGVNLATEMMLLIIVGGGVGECFLMCILMLLDRLACEIRLVLWQQLMLFPFACREYTCVVASLL